MNKTISLWMFIGTMLVFVLFGCKHFRNMVLKSNSVYDIPVIDLEEGLRNEGDELWLSQIADSVIYIPLQPNGQHLLGTISHVEVDGDNIFVQTSGTSSGAYYYRFNRRGEFLNSFGAIGRGPGEYLASSFSIDYDNQEFVIFRWYTSKDLISYTYDGKYKGNLNGKAVYDSQNFTCLPGRRYIFQGSFSGQQRYTIRKPNMFEMYDSSGTLLDSIPHPMFIVKDENADLDGAGSFFGMLRNGKDVYLYSAWGDTIYLVDGETFKPFAVIDRGRYSAPPEYRYNRVKSENQYLLEYAGAGFMVCDSMLFIEQNLNDLKVLFRYDRISRKVSSSHIKSIGKDPIGYLRYDRSPWFKNDLSNDENTTFYINVRKRTGKEGEIIAKAIPAVYYYGNTINSAKSYDEDNPVIMLVYLKR